MIAMPISRCSRLKRMHHAARYLLITAVLAGFWAAPAGAQGTPDPNAPVVRKVEPPNWWVGLTPEVVVLLSGKNLLATHAQCNLPEVIVSRTQSTLNGHYLFVWLKFSPQLRSGTAVCRIATANGETSFEFPIAARKQILGRNQGLSQDDVIYLIMPDRFADGDPTNDEPKEAPGSHDRGKARAYHGGDLSRNQGALAVPKGSGDYDAVVDPYSEKRVSGGLSRLWRGGPVRSGSTLWNIEGLPRPGSGGPSAAHESIFRCCAEPCGAVASLGQ